MEIELNLDFNNQRNLIEEVNMIAGSFNLKVKMVSDTKELIIIKYIGFAEGIFSLGKYIGEKKYKIEIASK